MNRIIPVEGKMSLLLRERGKIVPGSRRETKNVVTNTGRQYLADRTAANSFGPIVEKSNAVMQYIGLGTGTQLEVPAVGSLVNGIQVDGAGNFMKQIGVPTFPIATTVRFTVTFLTTELTYPGGPATLDLTEAGLFLSEYVAGGAMVTTLGNNEVQSYCTFEQITKTGDFALDVQWEWRF